MQVSEAIQKGSYDILFARQRAYEHIVSASLGPVVAVKTLQKDFHIHETQSNGYYFKPFRYSLLLHVIMRSSICPVLGSLSVGGARPDCPALS